MMYVEYRLYICAQGAAHSVIGMIKVGVKKLFIRVCISGSDVL